jgi:mono/diheme cytochrome c family protein
MMRVRLPLVVLSIIFLLWVFVVAVLAQDEPTTEVPPSYKGMENPFSWSDASVQGAGKVIYQRSCLGCHGVTGSGTAGSDFGAADFPQSLEERPDYYFWKLGDGELDKGMPAYKSVLSEEQRWQILTYLWSIGKAPPPGVTPPAAGLPAEVENGTLLLTAPEQAQSGQPLTLSAILQDSQGKPNPNNTVKFFIRMDFFTSGLMEIGDAITNDKGNAVLEYTPRQSGAIEVVARHGTIEAATRVSLTETDQLFYHPEVGIEAFAPGEEVFISIEPVLELGEGSSAPAPVFRLPTGVLAWAAPLLLTVIAIWVTCLYVIYQVYRIPIIQEAGDTNTRRIPAIGLVVAVVLGIMIVLMLITGPYSNFHLLR